MTLSKKVFQREIIVPLSKEYNELDAEIKQKIKWIVFYRTKIKSTVRNYFKKLNQTKASEQSK